MIYVFTSLANGGMLHFAISLHKEMCKMNMDNIVVLPNNAELIYNREKTILYNSSKTLAQNRDLNVIINDIKKDYFNILIITDSSLLSMQLTMHIYNDVITCFCIHDSNPHLTYINFRSILIEPIKHKFMVKTSKYSRYVIFMSKETRDSYLKICPNIRKKSIIFNLGDTLSENINQYDSIYTDCPHDYILFIGRIDKYKGIKRLLVAYEKVKEKLNYKLIIAGEGFFSKEEMKLIKRNPEIIIINNHINNGDMFQLISSSQFVILPYIEASQSGVLPVAYNNSIPIIASNVPGLAQFVIDGTTGLIFETQKQLEDILVKINDSRLSQIMGSRAKEYYNKNLDWKTNITNLFQNVNIRKSER